MPTFTHSLNRLLKAHLLSILAITAIIAVALVIDAVLVPRSAPHGLPPSAPSHAITAATQSPPAAAPDLPLPAGAKAVVIMLADQHANPSGRPAPDLMLLTINRVSQPGMPKTDIAFITIPTDTLVYVPGWRTHTIAQAFAHGGPDGLKATIQYNFGLAVDHYVLIDIRTAIQAIDEYGGASIFARCKLDANLILPTGQRAAVHIPRLTSYTLTGAQALAYAYAPYSDLRAQVALGRRGEEVVRGIYRIVKSAGLLKNPARLITLYNEYISGVQTDLTLPDLLDFYLRYAQAHNTHALSRSIAGAGVTRTTLPDVGSVLVVDRDALATYLHRALRPLLDQPPTNAITVEVLNGTSEPHVGLAAADRLSELGFDVPNLGHPAKPADHLYAHTTLVDLTGTSSTSAVSSLQREFAIASHNVIQGTAVPNAATPAPRYQLIVGADYDPCTY